MDDLVTEQRRALQISRRRKKKSEKDRKPLTLTGAMIDLSKDGIDKPVYEGLIKAKAIPKKRSEIIGPPCGPPGINLNPDNLPVILTEEEKIQFHIRVRDEKIRREREDIEKNDQIRLQVEDETRLEQEAISKMQRFRNSSPRRPKNIEESFDWFCSSEDEKETKDDSQPLPSAKAKPTQSKGVRWVLGEIRRNRENILANSNQNDPEQLIKDDKTTTYAGEASTRVPDDKENTISITNNKSLVNNETETGRSNIRDLSESNKSENYRDENNKSESTLSPERNKTPNVIAPDAKSEEVHSEDEITDRSMDKKSTRSGINEYKKYLADREEKKSSKQTVTKDATKLKSILKDDTNSVRLSQSTVNSKSQSVKSKDIPESQKSNKGKSKKKGKKSSKKIKGDAKKSSPINIVNVKEAELKKDKTDKISKSKKKLKSSNRNASMISNASEKSMEIDNLSMGSKSKGKDASKKKKKSIKNSTYPTTLSVDKENSVRSKITDRADSIKSGKPSKSKLNKKSEAKERRQSEVRSTKSDAASIKTDKSKKKESYKKSKKIQKKKVKDGERERAIRVGHTDISDVAQLSQSSKHKTSTLREKLETASSKATPKKSSIKKSTPKSKSKKENSKKAKSSKKSSNKSSPKNKSGEESKIKSKSSNNQTPNKSKSSRKEGKEKVAKISKDDKENTGKKSKSSSKSGKPKDKVNELKQKIENKIKVNQTSTADSKTDKIKKKKLKDKRKKKNEINAEDYMI